MKYQDNNALLIDYVNYSEMILKLCQLTDQVDMKNYLLEVRKYYMTIQQNINESDCFLALPNLKKILSLNKLEYQTLIFVTFKKSISIIISNRLSILFICIHIIKTYC